MGPAGESVGGGVATPPHARRRGKEELSSRLVSGGLPSSPRKYTDGDKRDAKADTSPHRATRSTAPRQWQAGRQAGRSPPSPAAPRKDGGSHPCPAPPRRRSPRNLAAARPISAACPPRSEPIPGQYFYTSK